MVEEAGILQTLVETGVDHSLYGPSDPLCVLTQNYVNSQYRPADLWIVNEAYYSTGRSYRGTGLPKLSNPGCLVGSECIGCRVVVVFRPGLPVSWPRRAWSSKTGALSPFEDHHHVFNSAWRLTVCDELVDQVVVEAKEQTAVLVREEMAFQVAEELQLGTIPPDSAAKRAYVL